MERGVRMLRAACLGTACCVLACAGLALAASGELTYLGHGTGVWKNALTLKLTPKLTKVSAYDLQVQTLCGATNGPAGTTDTWPVSSPPGIAISHGAFSGGQGGALTVPPIPGVTSNSEPGHYTFKLSGKLSANHKSISGHLTLRITTDNGYFCSDTNSPWVASVTHSATLGYSGRGMGIFANTLHFKLTPTYDAIASYKLRLQTICTKKGATPVTASWPESSSRPLRIVGGKFTRQRTGSVRLPAIRGLTKASERGHYAFVLNGILSADHKTIAGRVTLTLVTDHGVRCVDRGSPYAAIVGNSPPRKPSPAAQTLQFYEQSQAAMARPQGIAFTGLGASYQIVPEQGFDDFRFFFGDTPQGYRKAVDSVQVVQRHGIVQEEVDTLRASGQPALRLWRTSDGFVGEVLGSSRCAIALDPRIAASFFTVGSPVVSYAGYSFGALRTPKHDVALRLVPSRYQLEGGTAHEVDSIAATSYLWAATRVTITGGQYNGSHLAAKTFRYSANASLQTPPTNYCQ